MVWFDINLSLKLNSFPPNPIKNDKISKPKHMGDGKPNTFLKNFLSREKTNFTQIWDGKGKMPRSQ